MTACRAENKQRTKSNQVALDRNHPASRQKTTSEQETTSEEETLLEAHYPTDAKLLAFLSEANKNQPARKLWAKWRLNLIQAVLISYIFTVKKKKIKFLIFLA